MAHMAGWWLAPERCCLVCYLIVKLDTSTPIPGETMSVTPGWPFRASLGSNGVDALSA
jgi:hypothetical protein